MLISETKRQRDTNPFIVYSFTVYQYCATQTEVSNGTNRIFAYEGQFWLKQIVWYMLGKSIE